MSAPLEEWIEHDGKGQPVDDTTMVCVRFKDGEETSKPQPASNAGSCWFKMSLAPNCTITHYRVHKNIYGGYGPYSRTKTK
ncbi:hypothetical protein EON76_05095 [bacterium]|nr:MAG: hypothetical protein EON76_05095 [bacterium]